MIISGITPPQVWAASSRSLTNIGSGALASTSALFTTIAASASVDLRPSAGTLGYMTLGVQNGATSTAGIALIVWDGAANITIVASATAGNSQASATLFNTSAVGARILNNDAAIAGHYLTAAFVFTI